MELTGNESPRAFAELIEAALDHYLANELEAEVASVRVRGGFQPHVVVELRNGAEWQITPVRSAWPDDGTSAQFADVEEEVAYR